MVKALARTVIQPAESAPSRAPVDRERLLAAMVSLCEAGHGQSSPEAAVLIENIFLDLIKRTERDLRLRLADQLSFAPWAPSGLINALALDDIEIARPLIARSPVLKDHDLIRVLTMATIEHQIEVARRPDLGGDVVKAILDQADPVVMTTLAGNETADISGLAMTRLVAASRKIASLRAPLSRHPNLNLELACALYSWVGDVLKGEIIGRFKVDAAALDKALGQVKADALSGAASPANGESDQQDMETRLVAKLEAADQLRPGFLLRSLREGKLHLFKVALASLASVRIEDVQAAVDADKPEILALACAAVGIDRSVFPTILSLVRALNEGKPRGSAESLVNINTAFTLKGETEAIAAFRSEVAAL